MAMAILLLLAGYASLGVIFGVLFLWRGVAIVDRAAAHAPWGFRILIFPGVVGLWPFLARRWMQEAGKGANS